MANSGQVVMLYAAGIHDAIASGELAKMKEKAQEAEKHLNEYGDVSSALAVLKAEIAKLDK